MRTRIPLCLLVILLGVPSWASDGANPDDYDWLKGFTLVELETDDIGSLHAAHAYIRSRGGNIALLSPPSLLLGWIPEDIAQSLIGKAGIRAIHHDVIGPRKVRATDSQSNRMVRYFNAVASGEYQRRAALRKASAGPPRFADGGDVLQRDPIDEVAYLRNLKDQGFDLNALRDRGILMGKTANDPDRVQGQSDRMTGTSTVTLMFVESDGSGADPDLYTWTDTDLQDYVNGVNTGMAWWSSMARLYNDCWAAFFVRWFDPASDARLHQWREMVLHSSLDVDDMVVDVMGNFGYNSGSHLSRVDAFNSAQCATYGTDWAYTGFVAYNPLPAPSELTNGRSAFAYLTGPYTFLLFRSYGWLPKQVFAHESGHIYGACDEYQEGCTCGVLCLGEQNLNCEDCGSNTSCMMKANTFILCSYTDEQVGWHDTSPCAPPPLAAPTVNSVTPSGGSVGTSMQLTVTGSNFLYGAFSDLGADVIIDKTTALSGDTVLVDITIPDHATPGLRDLAVLNRDLQTGTLVNGFAVLATTRHYYSATGGDVYPYITSADAAISLSNAIAAATAGDSVLVESAPLALSSLVIDRGVILYGGWINNFTQRDIVNNKTVLNLTNNVNVLVTGGGTGGLDGFELVNGSGSFRPSPQSGDYGGAVVILSSSGHVGNCAIYSNQTDSGGFGGGGAIFAANATVNVVDNDIHDNSATRGGAIYLLDSSGTVARNTLANNVVSVAGTEKPHGAAILVENCNNLTLQDNVVDGNTGAESGGGLKIINSTAVSVSGGSILNHSVGNSGGGADVENSQVDFTGVVFESNSSGWQAGGVDVDSSVVQVVSCRFVANSAILYAGLYSTNTDAFVRHNLFTRNSGGFAGAMTLARVGAGEVTGNTLDLNIATSGAASIRLDDAAIEVTNNIVSNSNGIGIECVNTLPTLVDWNLVVNSSGLDYSGCAPGPNAVVGDPVYVDTTIVDYHLGLHSAAIDAGRTDPGYEDPDGSRGDLGMFGSHSFTMEQPTFPTGLATTMQAGNVILSWTPNPEPDVASYAVYADTTGGFRPDATNFVTLVSAPDSTLDLGPLGEASFYTIAALDNDGYSSGFAVQVQSPDPTDVPTPGPVAYAFRLYANVPNPFNPMTRIPFELDRGGSVRLEVYDLAGRLVRTLVRGERGAGPHVVLWDGRTARGQRVSSGVYVYRLQFGERERTRKMVLLK